jgi:hypothetical protein
MDPYEKEKLLAIDYRFWNVFHSNFYATVIIPARKGKICKMQYIDFNELQDKEESEFNTAILSYDKFELSDTMSFRYDWNREILAQFHATYFWNKEKDEMHWMVDDRHYRISFESFCQILGFGRCTRPILGSIMRGVQSLMRLVSCEKIQIRPMAGELG